MYKFIFLIFSLLLSHYNQSYATSAKQWLQKADAFRLSADSSRVNVFVDLYKNGQLIRSREYLVYSKPGRRSLVLFKSEDQLGQKVLMIKDDFHLFLAKSKRAIRITPMQKLLGDASTGDIANMTWHEDYNAELKETSLFENKPAHILELQAKHAFSTYTRILLFVDKTTGQPLHAKLFLQSGKLAKEAYYHIGSINQQPLVTGMTLLDSINPTQVTRIRYTAIEQTQFPDKFFNVQYLLRNPVE